MWKPVVVGLLSAQLAVSCVEWVNNASEDPEWWNNGLIYQVYPRSYKDSNGDGIGDLNGITDKLKHIKDTGAVALWLSPIYESPQVDFGYDISNFTAIDPTFGTLADFHKLTAKAKSLGLKVLLDLVPNHSSDKHEWFKKSIKRIKPYDEYYIWRDGKKAANGSRLPPNNWLSVFGGASWTWNEERKQYYYHQFASAQPDLNYRDPALQKEMEAVITFWLDQGVDGFRIDAIIHMYEDIQLRDEPLSHKPNALPNEYDYLEHLYTKDQMEIYDTVKKWRKLIDDHAQAHASGRKFAIVEAGSPMDLMMRYYQVGMDPFNFMFTTQLNNNSRPSEFARKINEWMENMPRGKSANWVIGNHDGSRVASRFGYQSNRADQLSMMSAMLPGITIIYNGDEIGMVNRPMSFEETVDPAGCNAGRDRYQLTSRDPARTPFQWDNSTSAGFTTSPKTWLPVHDNYKTLNLAAQERADVSHFKVFQAAAQLKSYPLLKEGQLEVSTSSDDSVLAIVRRLPHNTPIALLVNFEYQPIKLDLRPWLHLPDVAEVYIASVKSGLRSGTFINTKEFTLPAAATVILIGRYEFKY